MNSCSYQISVDEAVGLQVLHALADVQADTQQGPQTEAAPPLPEEVQQAAVLHELCDDVNGLLLAADSIQLHQFTVRQFPEKNKQITDRDAWAGTGIQGVKHYFTNIPAVLRCLAFLGFPDLLFI